MILLIYFLKLIACNALFYGYYFFFLRNKQLHQYNRFYILASLTLTIILPLIQLPLIKIGKEEEIIATTLRGIAFGGWEKEILITVQSGFLHSVITIQSIVLSIYMTGLLIAVYSPIRSLVSIRTLALKHKAEEFRNIKFFSTDEPGTPFSFFNLIFWNRNIVLQTVEGQQIFRHELYHVKQKHSCDILYMQLACSLLWFNPFFYFMNRELRAIHEFLADEYAASLTDRPRYAELLLMQTISPKHIFISNQFFYNQIKRRITMILQTSNTRYSYIRKAMAMPVVLLVFCACSVKNKEEDRLSQATQIETKKVSATNTNEIFTKVEIEPSYPNGPTAWIKYLNKNFKYPQEAQEKESQGTVLVRFIVEKDGSIQNVETIQGKTIEGFPLHSKTNYASDESLNKEAIRMVVGSGKWLPAIQHGVSVRSYKIQPITFMLEAE